MAPDTKPQALPLIMVAPNGARRTKVDHPALPVTIAETVEAAVACFEAGAGAIHAHVRDETGAHVLDKDLYQALLSELNVALPQMQVQITTEAVGKYTPDDQRKLVQDLVPSLVSIAVREMVPDGDTAAAAEFYSWALKEGISVQHILYSAEDLDRFFDLVENGTIPGVSHHMLLVLGRYADNQESAPEDLQPFLDRLKARRGDYEIDWGVCAFGHRETECLVHAIENGGKARIGFENGLWNRDGAVAKDNADRVRDLVSALEEKNISAL
ncbi:3-keto-5-aminohexanoate cleavage protein [Roseibium sp.]|uniref:3-keto-5-aminohexanoate cleavage protein n=1 Tax=Roseibium sp. TaxID=1936156 RepID=UPI003D126FBA